MKKQNESIEFKTVAIAGMVIVGIVAIVALDKTSYPIQPTNKKIELTTPPLIFPKNSKSTKKRGKKLK